MLSCVEHKKSFITFGICAATANKNHLFLQGSSRAMKTVINKNVDQATQSAEFRQLKSATK